MAYDQLTLPVLLLQALDLRLANLLQQWGHYRHPQANVSNWGCLAAKHIGHKIGLPRVVKDLTIIILHHI